MNERIIELLEENQKLRNCIEGMENDLTLKDGIIRRQTVMLAQRETYLAERRNNFDESKKNKATASTPKREGFNF